MRYNYENNANELIADYERITLEKAYKEKKISLWQIITGWWLYIASNAVCVFMCVVAIAAALLVLLDSVMLTQCFMDILAIIANNPAGAGCMAVAIVFLISYALTKYTMRNELIEIEKECEYR